MALSAGTRLGPYEIQSVLGAGGMGEVYRALDTRLDRTVAIKVLPESFAADSERLRRFEQEARAVAALNHPNILALYDTGFDAGVHYLVTELLDGEPLRKRLSGGPIGTRRAVEFAVQIAHGLAAAHEKGIIHRDLKPDNIFITRDGRVKILDFGLAKHQKKAAAADATMGTLSPEVHTAAGFVLGTFGYMSPEQVRGQDADPRSDIFAFGSVLYEMLSGRGAFQRDSSADTFAAILKEDPPDLADSATGGSPAIERILRRCLEKQPDERFQSAKDLAFALEAIGHTSATSKALKSSTAPQWRKPAATAAIVMVSIALGAAGFGWLRRSSTNLPEYRQLTFERGLVYSARFGADGHNVYYSAGWDGEEPRIYVTNPSSPESEALPYKNSVVYAAGASELLVSTGCEGVFIGICRATLARVPISGGSPHAVVDNVIAADIDSQGEIAVVRQVGDRYRVEYPLDKVIHETSTWMASVRISPQRDAIAVLEYVGSTVDGDAGHALILDREGKELAHTKDYISAEGLAWSPDGKEAWYAATATEGWADSVYAVTRSGKERVIMRFPGFVQLHDVAPDGRVLFSRDINRSELRIGSVGHKESDLNWLDSTLVSDISPDGKTIAFSAYGEAFGAAPITLTRSADGTPAAKLGVGYAPMMSQDGATVVVIASDPPRLRLLPTGVGQPRDLTAPGMKIISEAGWLPDGKSVYFLANDSHEWKIYVQNIGGGAPRAITTTLAPPLDQQVAGPRVSRDGKLIFARTADRKPLLFPLDGGAPRTALGVEPADNWVTWSTEAGVGFVSQDRRTEAPVFRVNISTGKREQIRNLIPADLAGVSGLGPVRVTPDGKSYAYTVARTVSDLFIARGVR